MSSTGSDAGDHPPITPMGSATRDQVRDSDWKLYDFITRHFLATVSLGSIKWELVFVCLELGGKRGVNVNFIWAQLCRGGCTYAWVGCMANWLGRPVSISNAMIHIYIYSTLDIFTMIFLQISQSSCYRVVGSP